MSKSSLYSSRATQLRTEGAQVVVATHVDIKLAGAIVPTCHRYENTVVLFGMGAASIELSIGTPLSVSVATGAEEF